MQVFVPGSSGSDLSTSRRRLIYPASFISSRFEELYSSLGVSSRIIATRKRSKWLRSLDLAMACDSCGRSGGDPACCGRGEGMGAGRSVGLDANTSREGTSGSAPRAVSDRNGGPLTLPRLWTLLPPGEQLESVIPRAAPRPAGEAIAGYRPSGSVTFGRSGISGRSPEVPVWRTVGALVDGTGRQFCTRRGCERPSAHGGRCGRWAVCQECGVDYGSRHLETCHVRPSGPVRDKPPDVCNVVGFCLLPLGHLGPHAVSDWRGFRPP